MRQLFLDFDRTLFDTEAFYNSLELTYIEGIIAGAIGADFSRFLYPDVIRFMQKCQKAGYLCHLVTFGRRSVQECKVKLSGIEPYFGELFYVEQGSKAVIIENYLNSGVSHEKVLFIDDTLEHLEDFTQLVSGGVPVRMRRSGAKGSDIEDGRFQTCSNLDEFFALISG